MTPKKESEHGLGCRPAKEKSDAARNFTMDESALPAVLGYDGAPVFLLGERGAWGAWGAVV
jgi:hypothetical protein